MIKEPAKFRWRDVMVLVAVLTLKASINAFICHRQLRPTLKYLLRALMIYCMKALIFHMVYALFSLKKSIVDVIIAAITDIALWAIMSLS